MGCAVSTLSLASGLKLNSAGKWISQARLEYHCHIATLCQPPTTHQQSHSNTLATTNNTLSHRNPLAISHNTLLHSNPLATTQTHYCIATPWQLPTTHYCIATPWQLPTTHYCITTPWQPLTTQYHIKTPWYFFNAAHNAFSISSISSFNHKADKIF